LDSAVLMSLVQPGRRLENARHAYLHNLLDRVSTHPAGRVEDVSPARRLVASFPVGERIPRCECAI
jgi:hypothetical protein